MPSDPLCLVRHWCMHTWFRLYAIIQRNQKAWCERYILLSWVVRQMLPALEPDVLKYSCWQRQSRQRYPLYPKWRANCVFQPCHGGLGDSLSVAERTCIPRCLLSLLLNLCVYVSNFIHKTRFLRLCIDIWVIQSIAPLSTKVCLYDLFHQKCMCESWNMYNFLLVYVVTACLFFYMYVSSRYVCIRVCVCMCVWVCACACVRVWSNAM